MNKEYDLKNDDPKNDFLNIEYDTTTVLYRKSTADIKFRDV